MRYIITLEVSCPPAEIQGEKERVAMALEKLGDVTVQKVTAIRSRRVYEQTRIGGEG